MAPDTRERMIAATMDLITEVGLHNITNRKVAERAQVNVAAISYHFGSQAGLIDEALRTMTDELREAFLRLRDSEDSAATKLRVFIAEYTDIAYRHPEIVTNVVNRLINESPLDFYSDWMSFITDTGIDIVRKTLQQIHPEYDKKTGYLQAMHLIAGLAFPFLMGSGLASVMRVDLADPKSRRRHVDSTLALFLN